MQAIANDDVHQPQGQRNIGAGIDGNVPIGKASSAGAIGIDHHQLGPVTPGLFDERPEMNVVAVNVGGPGDDVLRVTELFGFGPDLASVDRDNGVAAGLRTDAAVQLRRSQAMKEPPIHGGIAKHAYVAAVGIRQDCLRPVLRADAAQTGRYLVEGFVPANALESAIAVCAFRGRSPHGIEDPVGRIDTVKIFRNFRTQKTARDGMFGIALDPGGASVLHRNEHGASVGTIARSGSVDHLFHTATRLSDYATNRGTCLARQNRLLKNSVGAFWWKPPALAGGAGL